MDYRQTATGIAEARGWEMLQEGEHVAFVIPVGEARSQQLTLLIFDDEGHSMFRFFSRVGPVDKLDSSRLRRALELNSRLVHGWLAVEDGDLVMTGTMPGVSCALEELSRAMESVARLADTYEKLVFGQDVH